MSEKRYFELCSMEQIDMIILVCSLERELELHTSWTKHHQRTVEIVMNRRYQLEEEIKVLEEKLKKVGSSHDKSIINSMIDKRNIIDLQGMHNDMRKERDHWADKYLDMKLILVESIVELAKEAAKGTVLEMVHRKIIQYKKKHEKTY